MTSQYQLTYAVPARRGSCIGMTTEMPVLVRIMHGHKNSNREVYFKVRLGQTSFPLETYHRIVILNAYEYTFITENSILQPTRSLCIFVLLSILYSWTLLIENRHGSSYGQPTLIANRGLTNVVSSITLLAMSNCWPGAIILLAMSSSQLSPN